MASFVGICTQDAIAATLINDGTRLLDAPCSDEPDGVDVWLDGLRSWGIRSAAVVDGVEDSLCRLFVHTSDLGDTMPGDPTPRGEPQPGGIVLLG